MGKTDVVVRTPQDLEKKYNFASLLGLKKNIEITTQGMQKIENELNNMLNALVINLKDVLDSQSEISLWFYSAKPTTTNEPYVSWGNPNDHMGDIYYDQSTGKVYQWNGQWEVNTYPDLVEAMAITNAETDTTTDHERIVFFDTPTVPYSSGDWWINEDGHLFICQISKKEGVYEEADFINSNAYTESIAEKVAEELKVLKGTVTTISENYAKFTDLATGGSTTIAGENITTGNIQSQNYIENVSGTKINLLDGKIDSKNFKTDEEGNVTLGSGTQENPSFRILGENGTNLILTETLASIIGNGGSVAISGNTNDGGLAGIGISTNNSDIQLYANDTFVSTKFSYGDNYISSFINSSGATFKVGNNATGEEVVITPNNITVGGNSII